MFLRDPGCPGNAGKLDDLLRGRLRLQDRAPAVRSGHGCRGLRGNLPLRRSLRCRPFLFGLDGFFALRHRDRRRGSFARLFAQQPMPYFARSPALRLRSRQLIHSMTMKEEMKVEYVPSMIPTIMLRAKFFIDPVVRMKSAMTVSRVAPEVMNVLLRVCVTLVSRMVRRLRTAHEVVVLSRPVEVDDRVVDRVTQDRQDGRDGPGVDLHPEDRVEGRA